MQDFTIEIVLTVIIIIISAVLGRSFAKLSLKDLIVLAIFVAISVAGRYLLVAIPSVKPCSFIIITAGLLYGPAAGFFTGVATGLLSNLFLGMGPYVLWQMFCWGTMGLISGFLKNRGRIFISIYGFVWGFLFGWMMNPYTFKTLSPETILRTYHMVATSKVQTYLLAMVALAISSVFFDLAHAITNFSLLICFPHNFIKNLLKKSSIK